MFPDENHGVPESFFVFIVGVNEQWENGRAKHGDIALFNTYIAAGVPSDQIVFVKDKDATKSNCEKRLTQFLKVSTPSSTLVFYYGGVSLNSRRVCGASNTVLSSKKSDIYFSTWHGSMVNLSVSKLMKNCGIMRMLLT